MTDPQTSNIEARLSALERAVGNPHRLTQGDVVSLKEHIETRLRAIEQAFSMAIASLEKRLDGVSAIGLVSRKELDLQVDKICADITSLREFKAELEGKASANAVYVGYFLSIVGIIMGIIGLLRG